MTMPLVARLLGGVCSSATTLGKGLPGTGECNDDDCDVVFGARESSNDDGMNAEGQGEGVLLIPSLDLLFKIRDAKHLHEESYVWHSLL